MLRGIAAIEESGIPVSHANVFQSVANQTRCVISSRAVGKWATGLLLESYATKGFHNKAKSCPWGPMAGFVLADPRFTKNNDSEGQRKDLLKTIQEHASETPLFITDDRRRDLEGPLKRMTRTGGNINNMVYTAVAPSGKSMKFVLKRAMDGPGANGKQLWQVFYAKGEVRLSNDLFSPNTVGGGSPGSSMAPSASSPSSAPSPSGQEELLPVMAIVDAACPPEVQKTYRAATTGDYDLFAVFPPVESFNRGKGGMDARMVPNSDRFKLPIQSFIQHENKHLGNLTPRIAEIRNKVNSGVRGIGYAGGDVVHHSDEAGRPMISSIDFPFIAFVPGASEPYVAQNRNDFKTLIGLLFQKYVMSFNPGWQRELGFSTTGRGSYEV